jgi:hypothetical protein
MLQFFPLQKAYHHKLNSADEWDLSLGTCASKLDVHMVSGDG